MKDSIEEVLRIAKELRPNLYKRMEEVARIIDPSAFGGDWVVSDPAHQKLVDTRQQYMRAVAMSKAQDILRYLGVNTDTDWYEILTQLAKEANE